MKVLDWVVGQGYVPPRGQGGGTYGHDEIVGIFEESSYSSQALSPG